MPEESPPPLSDLIEVAARLEHAAGGAVDAAAESRVAPALAVRPPTGDRGR